ncbi:NAD(P)H-binding protein [Segetibacter koreensis]|uniref:NAD(P)H-binding protein n=1 Tax=Segetibacter koreensis TaxID=398037 RepID=UPI00035DF39E|nr:NAD(P)H-binding protein [Segetibacter koreensis]
MKNIIIAGSTGMIGNLILQNCLKRNDVQKVTSITRRRSQINDVKLVEVLHTDFLNYDSVNEYFKNQDICFYCIGVYTGQVPRNEFRKITVDYTNAFAKALKENSPEATFCFLSGQGADQSEKSVMMFAKDKGIAENILLSYDFPHTYIFRPGYIYPVTPRKEPNVTYKIMRGIYPFLNRVYHSGVINSEELSNAMVDIGINSGNKIIYENNDIRQHKIQT